MSIKVVRFEVKDIKQTGYYDEDVIIWCYLELKYWLLLYVTILFSIRNTEVLETYVIVQWSLERQIGLKTHHKLTFLSVGSDVEF